MKKKLIVCMMLLLLVANIQAAEKEFKLQSPDQRLSVIVSVGRKITYQVKQDNDLLLLPSPISMTLTGGKELGVNPKLSGTQTKSVNTFIVSPFYKRASVQDNYNELVLRFNPAYSLTFRTYNEGVAYHFSIDSQNPFEVEKEEWAYLFPEDHESIVSFVRPQGYHKDNMDNSGSFESQFFKSFVSVYTQIPLSAWDSTALSLPPFVLKTAGGKRICITEGDLLNYPGSYLHREQGLKLKGVSASYPKNVKRGGHDNLQEVVTSREHFIAKYDKGVDFPWRIMIVTENDKDLLDNDMVFKLASPCQIEDVSWIKPGKATWEWWNDWNVFGVDFQAGINTDTYKYYIDFAADNKLEYLVMDDGWAGPDKTDLYSVVPELDMKELADYANSKNVGLILWAGGYAFKKDMEGVCKHYSELGIKGFKLDFMDRDDQTMVAFHREVARIAAKYRLVIDFHGTYKPAGLQRTWPNVLTVEAVQGLEHMKWAKPTVDQVTHDAIIPFVRMVAGPMDYTQGAMLNATKDTYRPVYQEPMSQGTRCRQIAQYIIYESPLSMLCDSPSKYKKEQECTDFISSIPTCWDNTHVLGGEIAKHATIARQKGGNWFVGSITNWEPRDIELNLIFLGEGAFEAEVFRDGINADRIASDYKREIVPVPLNRKMSLHLAPGGGFAMKIYKK